MDKKAAIVLTTELALAMDVLSNPPRKIESISELRKQSQHSSTKRNKLSKQYGRKKRTKTVAKNRKRK
jgi:hypothetical protein